MSPYPKMYYRVVGGTGLVSSVVGLGSFATFGSRPDMMGQAGIDAAKVLLKVAKDAGINFFDNAEEYGIPEGSTEEIFGHAYAQLQKEDPAKWRRSDQIITTKLFWCGQGVNEKGLSRKHLMEGLDKSLSRLQLEYVDLVYCHRPDVHTPTETVVRAMTDIIRSGKATAWGTSEWSSQQITEAYFIAKLGGLEPPQVEQPEYNLFHRDKVEREFVPLYKEPYKLGVTSYSPLASGLLTGKYKAGIPTDSRLAQPGFEWLQEGYEKYVHHNAFSKLEELENYAIRFGTKAHILALAWCLKNPNVSNILLGARTPNQLKANLTCLSLLEKLTDRHMEEIGEIIRSTPEPYWGDFKSFPTI